MITPRNAMHAIIPVLGLALAVFAQPAAATHFFPRTMRVVPAAQQGDTLGGFVVAFIRHSLAGSDTIHRG